jgi:hypothetical protein
MGLSGFPIGKQGLPIASRMDENKTAGLFPRLSRTAASTGACDPEEKKQFA